jgi:hypothetical protein
VNSKGPPGLRAAWTASCAISFLLTSGNVDAQSDREVNQANNPLASITAVGLQNYFIPSSYGVGETSNNLLLRPVLSTGFMIIRATLPINTVPDPNQPDPKSGLGDANIFDIFLLTGQGATFQFGAGPLFVARTATSSVLGTGKWQAGGAAVVHGVGQPAIQIASGLNFQFPPGP